MIELTEQDLKNYSHFCDPGAMGNDRSGLYLFMTQKTFDEMCNLSMAHTGGIKPKTPQELTEVINNTKQPWESFEDGQVVKRRIDGVIIQPEFSNESYPHLTYKHEGEDRDDE